MVTYEWTGRLRSEESFSMTQMYLIVYSYLLVVSLTVLLGLFVNDKVEQDERSLISSRTVSSTRRWWVTIDTPMDDTPINDTSMNGIDVPSSVLVSDHLAVDMWQHPRESSLSTSATKWFVRPWSDRSSLHQALAATLVPELQLDTLVLSNFCASWSHIRHDMDQLQIDYDLHLEGVVWFIDNEDKMEGGIGVLRRLRDTSVKIILVPLCGSISLRSALERLEMFDDRISVVTNPFVSLHTGGVVVEARKAEDKSNPLTTELNTRSMHTLGITLGHHINKLRET